MVNKYLALNKIRNLSIGWKFSVLICGVVLMMWIVSTILIESRLENALSAEHHERGLTVIRNLAADSVDLLLTDNKLKLHQLLSNIKSIEKDVAYIFVLDSEKHIFAHTFGEKGFPEVLLDANPAISSTEASHGLLRLVDDETIIHEFSILVMDGEAGAVHLGLSEVFIQDKVENIRKELLAITSFLCLFGVFAALLFARILNKPLMTLSIASDKVGLGEVVSKLPITANDEIGRLTATFNLMVNNIEEAKAKQNAVEDALRASKEEWEKTFDAMTDIITIQGKDMRIIKANKAAHDAFHAKKGDFEGKYCYEVFRQSNEPCLNCPELVTLQEGTAHSANITHENLGKIFHVTSAPVLNKDGEFTHLVHIAKDITEHKKMEAELFQAHKMEAIGTLAGGIAHDFNNILTAILGFTELTKRALPAGNKGHDYIAQVLKSSIRAKELVKQILTFSRKSQDSCLPMNPAVIIKEAVKMLHSSLPSTIAIQSEIDSNCGSLLANPTNIHQVLINLCTNAFQAMVNEKGVLKIKLSRVSLSENDLANEMTVSPGTFIELMVSDTGQGMDNETLGRIFEPYFTTKEVGKGSGIGLSLVLGIVQNSGGFIQVESKINKGTIFRVYWPVIDEKIEAKTAEIIKTQALGNEKILVVDDEETILKMYEDMLESLGYKVTTSSSSEKALEMFKASPDSFDLIISDQTMPFLTGSELAKNILQIRPGMPIIICTGYSSVLSEEQAKEIGIKRFITKPVTIKTMVDIVREVLDTRKSSLARR